MYFFIGLTVFGVFGSFTFYLPELFPTRLRSTGSGFCYNIGRVVTAGGVFAVGIAQSAAKGDPDVIVRTHVHDRLRAHRRSAAAALGRRDPRPEDAGLTSGLMYVESPRAECRTVVSSRSGPPPPFAVCKGGRPGDSMVRSLTFRLNLQLHGDLARRLELQHQWN